MIRRMWRWFRSFFRRHETDDLYRALFVGTAWAGLDWIKPLVCSLVAVHPSDVTVLTKWNVITIIVPAWVSFETRVHIRGAVTDRCFAGTSVDVLTRGFR